MDMALILKGHGIVGPNLQKVINTTKSIRMHDLSVNFIGICFGILICIVNGIGIVFVFEFCICILTCTCIFIGICIRPTDARSPSQGDIFIGHEFQNKSGSSNNSVERDEVITLPRIFYNNGIYRQKRDYLAPVKILKI